MDIRRHIILLIVLVGSIFNLSGQSTFFKSIPLFDGNDTGWTLVPIDDGYLIGAGSISYAENEAFTRIVKTDLEGNLVWEHDYENFPYQFGLGDIGSIGDTLFAVSGEYYTDTVIHRYRMFLNEQGDSVSFFLDQSSQNTSGRHLVVENDKIAYYGIRRIDDGTFHPLFTISDLQGNILLDTVYSDKLNSILATGSIDACSDGSYILSMKEVDRDAQYVMRVDSNGEELYFKEAIPSYWSAAPYVGCYEDGSYVTIVPEIDTFQPGPFSNTAHLIERYNKNDKVEWQKIIKQPFGFGPTFVRGMMISKNGDIIGFGIHGHGLDTLISGINSFGAWVFRMSKQTGEMLWERSYHYPDGSPSGTLFAVEEDKQGNIICVGDIIDTIPGTNNPSLNIWLLKLDSNGCLTPGCNDSLYLITSVEEPEIIPAQPNLFSVQPNPATDLVWMNITQRLTGDPWRVQVHTITGKLMHEQAISKGEQTIPIYLTGYPPGMYVVSLLHRNRVVDAGRVVVE